MTPPHSNKLGYPFTPIPDWLRAERREGRLSAQDYDLIGYLYERADFGKLARREETPRLSLEQIAEATRSGVKLPSLQKHLKRLTLGGAFTYRVEGNSRRGVRYVF